MPVFMPDVQPQLPLDTDIDPVIDTSAMQETPYEGIPLITDIEGEPWPVTYYHQLRVESEAARPLDPGLDPTQQQYQSIEQFVLSVTSDLNSSMSNDTQTIEVTGEGLIYPGTIIPHYGDMFVGAIEPGRLGVFTLTSVTRVGLYKAAAYQVEYRLFAENSDAYQTALDARVVQTMLMDMRRLKQGEAPIIDYKTANADRYYSEALRRLVGRLYTEFYHNRLQTFVVSSVNGVDYDPWAVKFFNAVIGRSGRFHYPAAIEYDAGISDSHVATQSTLWSAIRTSSESMLQRCPRSMHLIPASTLMRGSMHHSAVMAGISRIWMPEDWSVTDAQLTEDPYVVSHACYSSDADNMSAIEHAIWDVIRGHTVNHVDLRNAVEAVDSLTDWALFHQLIILIGLIRISMGVQR